MARVPSKTRKKIEWLLRRAEGALLPRAILAKEGAHLAHVEARALLAASAENIAHLDLSARVAQLEQAIDSADDASVRAYVDTFGVCGAQRFHAGERTRIYLMSVETLPRHVNNVYVILEPGSAIMLDCGSGLDSSTRDLALGFAIVRGVFGEEVSYEQLDWCIISHAHIDHFGGANLLKQRSRAKLAVHELDARVLACFDERLVVASKDLDIYWRRAGVPDDQRTKMLEMYGVTKRFFRAQEVDRTLRDGDVIGPSYKIIHVPGHCPGQICVQVHDVLLTSDHILARITPHQFPQAITPFGGLEHYFHSLSKVRKIEGLNLALGGHEDPIWDVRARIDAIALFHRDRLAKVLEHCATPKTVVGVAAALFGDQEGYGSILAIEEAGAHVEYLHQLGKLRIANLDEVARSRDPVIEYETRG
jgi:glyoxylase-like metal-dependent hydrolase (beta-lactamase superfamily II)